MQLEGSAFAVTGGASGLGLATARRIVKAGGRVTLIGHPAAWAAAGRHQGRS